MNPPPPGARNVPQVEQLRNKLNEAERQADGCPTAEPPVRTVSRAAHPVVCTPAVQQEAPLHADAHLRVHNDTQVSCRFPRHATSFSPASLMLPAKVHDWDPHGTAVGPLSKALNPTLLQGGNVSA